MTKSDWTVARVGDRHLAAIPLGLCAVTALSYLLITTLPLSADLMFIGSFTVYCLVYPALMIYAYYTAFPRLLAVALGLFSAATLAWVLL